MLGTGDFAKERLNSSKISVRDKETSEIFVIVVSHEFPLEQENVWHLNRDGIEIGRVTRIIEYSDISLMRLTQDISYQNEPFAAEPGKSTQLFIDQVHSSWRDIRMFDSRTIHEHEQLLPLLSDTWRGQVFAMKLNCDSLIDDRYRSSANWVLSTGSGLEMGQAVPMYQRIRSMGTSNIFDDQVSCLFSDTGGGWQCRTSCSVRHNRSVLRGLQH